MCYLIYPTLLLLCKVPYWVAEEVLLQPSKVIINVPNLAQACATYMHLCYNFVVVKLQAKIAFLNGERKGQENLKNDLVRRIKMLEYALKQER